MKLEVSMNYNGIPESSGKKKCVSVAKLMQLDNGCLVPYNDIPGSGRVPAKNSNFSNGYQVNGFAKKNTESKTNGTRMYRHSFKFWPKKNIVNVCYENDGSNFTDQNNNDMQSFCNGADSYRSCADLNTGIKTMFGSLVAYLFFSLYIPWSHLPEHEEKISNFTHVSSF